MKAKQWIKAGFFIYIGWQISSGIDQALGRIFMGALKESNPKFHDKLKARMRHIH